MSEEQQYRDGLERLLKEAADDFSLRPSASVWEQVAGQLPSAKKRFPYVLAAAALIVLLAGAGYFYLHSAAPVPSFTRQEVENQESAATTHLNNPQYQAATQVPKGKNTISQPPSQNTNSQVAASPMPESPRPEQFASASEDDEAISLNPLYNAFSKNRFIRKNPFSLEIPLKTGLSHSLAQGTDTSFVQKQEFPFSNGAPDISLPSSLKPATTSGRKWSWGFYIAPSVTYRSFDWSNGKSPGNTIAQAGGFILSDTTRVYHHSAMGLSAGFYLSRELARQWSAGIGLGVSKGGYRISAISNGTINSNPPPAATSTGMSMSSPVAGNDRNYFVNTNSLRAAMPSHPVTLKNQYYQINMPVIFHWKQPIGKKSSFLELSPGITMDYLFDDETNIFAPSSGIYFNDPSIIRRWNTSIQLGAAIDFPVSSGWQLGIGPQFRYQLLSTYSNGYEVQEHPYSVGMKISLSRKK